MVDFDLSNSSMNKGETLEDTLNAEMMGVDLCILVILSQSSKICKRLANMQFVNAEKEPFLIPHKH